MTEAGRCPLGGEHYDSLEKGEAVIEVKNAVNADSTGLRRQDQKTSTGRCESNIPRTSENFNDDQLKLLDELDSLGNEWNSGVLGAANKAERLTDECGYGSDASYTIKIPRGDYIVVAKAGGDAEYDVDGIILGTDSDENKCFDYAANAIFGGTSDYSLGIDNDEEAAREWQDDSNEEEDYWSDDENDDEEDGPWSMNVSRGYRFKEEPNADGSDGAYAISIGSATSAEYEGKSSGYTECNMIVMDRGMFESMIHKNRDKAFVNYGFCIYHSNGDGISKTMDDIYESCEDWV